MCALSQPPQSSGLFTVHAWVDASSDVRTQLPPTGAPQGVDMVDITCADGCYAARLAQISLR